MTETKIVYCKKHGKLKHPFITLEDCKKCDLHKGINVQFKGTDTIPRKTVVLCGLPVEVGINEFVQGLD